MDRREKNGKPGASGLPASLVTAGLMKHGFLNLYLAAFGCTFFNGADGDWRSDAKKRAVLIADRLNLDSAAFGCGRMGRFDIWLFFSVDRGSATQISPINVGPKLFASNRPAGFSLNFRAPLRRNWSRAVLPLRNKRRSN